MVLPFKSGWYPFLKDHTLKIMLDKTEPMILPLLYKIHSISVTVEVEPMQSSVVLKGKTVNMGVDIAIKAI